MSTEDIQALRSRVREAAEELDGLSLEFSRLDKKIDASENPEEAMIARHLAAKIGEAAYAATAYASEPELVK